MRRHFFLGGVGCGTRRARDGTIGEVGGSLRDEAVEGCEDPANSGTKGVKEEVASTVDNPGRPSRSDAGSLPAAVAGDLARIVNRRRQPGPQDRSRVWGVSDRASPGYVTVRRTVY